MDKPTQENSPQENKTERDLHAKALVEALRLRMEKRSFALSEEEEPFRVFKKIFKRDSERGE